MFEEIIDVDGRGYKLMTDYPLTIEQRVQTIEKIRNGQSGRQQLSDCGSCGDGNSKIQSLATCNVTKKYVGAPSPAGSLTLNTAPTGGTAPYNNVYFVRKVDSSVEILSGPYTIQTGGSQSYIFTPSLVHVGQTPQNFSVQMIDSCTGATQITDTGCNIYIVDLDVMLSNVSSVTIGPGSSTNVTFNYLDTGSPTPTAYPSSYLTMLTPSINSSYVTVTSLTATGATINMSSGAPVGTSAIVTFTARVGTVGTQKSVAIGVQTCSNPICNFNLT